MLATNGGKDATEAFVQANHPEKVKEIRKEFLIGKVDAAVKEEVNSDKD
jgi:cytochrome b involved in lipid metabolism